MLVLLHKIQSKMDSIWCRYRVQIISIFVVSYIATIGLWLMPTSSSRDLLIGPVKPLIVYLGLWQNYRVFAPKPKNVNADFEAAVTFDDQSETVWKYPRMEELSFFEKIQKERYRKFIANAIKMRILQPGLARFAARQVQNSDTEGRKPVWVKLVRHSANIPKPADGLGNPLPPRKRTEIFFQYQVKRKDLL